MSMNAPETQDLIDRFTCFIERVRDGVIGEQRSGNWIPWPLLYLLQERLGRIGRRFARLVTRFRAGTLPEVRARVVSATPRPAAAPVMVRLNRSALLHMVTGASVWRDEFLKMLDDPEMKVLIAGVPQLGRELRPLCGMLGITPPAGLALPARPRRARPARSKKARVPRVKRSKDYWQGPGYLRDPWDEDRRFRRSMERQAEREAVLQKRVA